VKKVNKGELYELRVNVPCASRAMNLVCFGASLLMYTMYVSLSVCAWLWQIVDAVPKDWFANCPRDSTLPQFDNLCRCLVSSTTSAVAQLPTPTAKRFLV